MKTHTETADGQTGLDFTPHPDVHSCSVCSKAFSSAEYLEEHARTHNKVRPFSCSECGKSFTQAMPLKKHKEIHARGQQGVTVAKEISVSS
jgi:uncharacterized Zn-finger protein